MPPSAIVRAKRPAAILRLIFATRSSIINSMDMIYALIILAYQVNTDPVETQYQFVAGTTYGPTVYTDEEACVEDLLQQVPGAEENNFTVYQVTYDLVDQLNFEWDWVIAGCQNHLGQFTATIHPTYDYAPPKALNGVWVDEQHFKLLRQH